MSDATNVFEREGFHTLAHVADTGRKGQISSIFEAEQEARIVVDFEEDHDAWDDDYDEIPVRETVQVGPGDIMFDLDDGRQAVLTRDQLAESTFRFSGDIEPGTRAVELSNHRVIAVGDMGDIVEYNAETGRLDARPVESPEYASLSFVDGNGDYVAPTFSARIASHFQSVIQKADDVDFDMFAFFDALSEGMHQRIEERDDVPQGVKHDVYLLNNAIEVAKAERDVGETVSAEPGQKALSADSWENALASLGPTFQLPGYNHTSALCPLSTMIPMMAAQDPAIVKTARQIYAPLTETPMEDVRVFQSTRGSEQMMAAEAPQATVRAHVQSYLENGQRLEIPEATHRAVSRVYAPQEMDLIEVEDMKVLFVSDEMGDALYFFPSNPELVDKADYAEEREREPAIRFG
ncbi:hypothetical protein [Salipiger mucosus]|uniref:Uncharacterized protein n=1 Tax=Salipiger mucosus DSM 16094 TaxID=1123237 RepID=S9QWT8_9RHOB|nr:hypothetical protein [Salipiger mucosus]EPX84068.1 hypothetical protein Salmuc_01843 [Salipiger mucosus DSM 16094]